MADYQNERVKPQEIQETSDPGFLQVITNSGRLDFPIYCPSCGNRDWDHINGWPEWRKCHHCDIQVKPQINDKGNQVLVILTEDRIPKEG